MESGARAPCLRALMPRRLLHRHPDLRRASGPASRFYPCHLCPSAAKEIGYQRSAVRVQSLPSLSVVPCGPPCFVPLCVLWASAVSLCARPRNIPMKSGRLFLSMPSSHLSPVAEEDEQILDADGAVAIEVGGTVIAVGARAPIPKQDEQILHANDTVAVKVAGDGGD